MPDNDEELNGPDSPDTSDSEDSEAEGDNQAQDSKIEERLAALELAQRQSVLEIRQAVGRVQSLSAKLDKTNDPQVEAKLRTELAGVSELLGLVTDSIDESILPRDVKRRVSDAQSQIRAAAADAEINRRIAEATRPSQAAPDIDANALEAAVISQIRGLGLNDQDPAFDWRQAAMILGTQGAAAMWNYFGEVEKKLLDTSDAGPQRRPKAAPPRTAGPAASVDNAKQLESFADSNDIDKGVALLRSMGVNI